MQVNISSHRIARLRNFSELDKLHKTVGILESSMSALKSALERTLNAIEDLIKLEPGHKFEQENVRKIYDEFQLALNYRRGAGQDPEASRANLRIADGVIKSLTVVIPNLASRVFRSDSMLVLAKFIADPPDELGAEILPGLDSLPIQAQKFISQLSEVDNWLYGKHALDYRPLRRLIKEGANEVHSDLSRTLIFVDAAYRVKQALDESTALEEYLPSAINKAYQTARGSCITALQSLADNLQVLV